MLENTATMLDKARRKGYCIGAFNVVDYLSMEVVIETAANQRAPVIVQTSPTVVKQYGAVSLVTMAKLLVDRNPTQVGLHLDHGTDLAMIQECIAAGFSSVMIDASHKPFDENISQTKEIVQLAHAHNVAVEAEIGIVAGVEDDIIVDMHDEIYTSPEEAITFQSRTECDFLAVAIGTAHGFYDAKPRLDINTLRILRARADFPLVVHGGSGLGFMTLHELVQAGASKLNISSQLKKTYLDALQEYLGQFVHEYNPLRMFAHARNELAAMVTSYVQVLGSCDQVNQEGNR